MGDAKTDPSVFLPDGPADGLEDTVPVAKDVLGDVRPPSDLPREAAPDGKGDAAAEEASGQDPGPEPGAEPRPELGKELGPEPGAEPGKEPGPERGPEPGPEPWPEPGPEPGPEPPRDGGTDATTVRCAVFFGDPPATGTVGHPPTTNSKEAFCVATCDDIQGWGCSNADDRTVTVNSVAAKCGDVVTKKDGYIVFRMGAGNNGSAAIYWWGTYATSCPPPAGGVFP